MTVTVHRNMIQGSDEWVAARRGLLTASEMEYILSPKELKLADNDKSRSHCNELLAQRVTGYVEPHYYSDDMLRGTMDEDDAVALYEDHYDEVERVGFVTNDKWGFKLGWSPDALIKAKKGGLEVKSRRQKLHIATLLSGAMPTDFRIQVQTGILVGELEWMDFISYCAGLPMFTVRIYPDAEVHAAIVVAATRFHDLLNGKVADYYARAQSPDFRLIQTERKSDVITVGGVL